MQWIDLLRLIYWYVPESYIQTVETILEQLLHQSSIEIAISIAAIIEDLSVEMFNNLRTNSFSYDYQTEDNHAFLNGRVIVTVADVRLIGVVMRTIFPKDGSRYSELRKPECVDSNQIIVSRAMLSAITTIVALIKSGADLVLLVNYIKDASEIIQHQCINNVHIIGPLFQLVVQLAIAQSANSSVDIINKFYKEIENVSSGSLSKLDCHNDDSERKDMFCYSYAQHSWICTARMTDMLNAFLIMSTPSSVTEKTLLSMIVEENVESVFDVLQRWFLLLFDMFPSAQKHLLEAVLDRLLNSENLMTDSEEDLNCIEDGESSGKTMNLNGKEEIALNSTTNTIFLKLLHEICSSRYNANNSDALGKTVLFSLVTLEDLPLDTNLSIQKSIVYCCVYNHDIYSSLLSINRKGLLHKSPERKFLSIKILIAILSTVKSETYQKEIMQALFYCFQLPIFLRSVFYGELVYLVSQLPSIVKTKTSEHRSRIAYDNSCNLSQQTILLLQHKLREISKQLCNNLSISKQDTTSCSSSAKNEFTALFLSQFIDRSNHLPTNNEHLLSEDLYQFILLCYYVDRRIGTESYHVDLYNSAFRMFNIDSDGYCLEDISTVASSPSIQIVSAIAGSLSNCLDVCKTAVKGSKSVDASACESKYDRLLCMVIAYVAVLAIVECLLDCHSSPIISVEESNNLTKRREGKTPMIPTILYEFNDIV